MDFKTVSRLSTLLAKPFAEDLLKLLLIYRDISASEAATRLDLHIKTAQDFFEELLFFEIVEKREVYERKRPYFRYKLKQTKLTIDVDLNELHESKPNEKNNKLEQQVKEKINAGATFTTSVDNTYISSVSFFIGEGRKRKVRKISLTVIQGRFLYYLPFPTEQPKNIRDILKRAGIEETHSAEILDIVEVLKENNVIEDATF
jgi:hypothetical protein